MMTPSMPQAEPATESAENPVGSWRSALSMIAQHLTQIRSMLSRETSSGRFIPEMDGLRFIAITMVVLFHLNAYLMAKTAFYEHEIAHPDWLCRAALTGSRGVELFFVISGFILALPFAAHRLTGAPAVDLRKYYLRRLTRLEPPYVVTLFALLLLTAWLRPAALPSKAHLAASLFYLHNLIYGAPSTALGVAWSLEIEVQFYLLVPILTLLFLVRKTVMRRALIGVMVLFAMAAQSEVQHLNARMALSIVGYVQFFLIGFLLADIFLLEWKTPACRLFWDLIAAVAWPLLFISLRSEVLTHWLFPFLVFVVYCAAFRGPRTSRFLSRPWITAIGGMCYSIYLIHYEVISAVGRFTKRMGQFLPDSLYLAAQFVLVGAAIVFVCGIYFLALEKPCMSRDWPQRLRRQAKRLVPLRHAEVEATFAD
jgi:peptidoglycan/LPS O-acetylase OafA/YrhL